MNDDCNQLTKLSNISRLFKANKQSLTKAKCTEPKWIISIKHFASIQFHFCQI